MIRPLLSPLYNSIDQWRRDGVCRPGQTSLLPPPPPQSDLQLIILWLQRWH